MAGSALEGFVVGHRHRLRQSVLPSRLVARRFVAWGPSVTAVRLARALISFEYWTESP